jgi:hypothetical protein
MPESHLAGGLKIHREAGAMDDANGVSVRDDASDEQSLVMKMIASEDWQTRLEAARIAREKALAAKRTEERKPLKLVPVPEIVSLDVLPDALDELSETAEPFDGGDDTPDMLALPPAAPLRTKARTQPDRPSLIELTDKFECPARTRTGPAMPPSAPVFRRNPDATEVQPRPAVPAPPTEVLPRRRADDAFPELTQPALPATAASAPQGVSLRIIAGFAIGLVAGVAATSVIWMTRPAVPVIAAPPETAVTAPQTGTATQTPKVAAAAAPQTVAEPKPIAVAPEAAAPAAIAVLPGASSLPGPVATAPDVLAVMPVAAWPAASPPPVQPVAPPPTTAFDAVIEKSVTRPDALAEIRSVAAPKADSLADLPPLTEAPAAVRLTVLAAPYGADDVPEAAELPPLPVLAPATSPLPRRSPTIPAVPPPPLAIVKMMAPSRLTGDEVAAQAESLRAAGYELGDPNRVNFTVSATHVRYYAASDREAAITLADTVGGEARDFTGTANGTPEGTLELWVKGSSAKAATPKVAASKPARTSSAKAKAPVAQAPKPPREDPQVKALRERLISKLKTVNKS